MEEKTNSELESVWKEVVVYVKSTFDILGRRLRQTTRTHGKNIQWRVGHSNATYCRHAEMLCISFVWILIHSTFCSVTFNWHWRYSQLRLCQPYFTQSAMTKSRLWFDGSWHHVVSKWVWKFWRNLFPSWFALKMEPGVSFETVQTTCIPSPKHDV